MFRVTCEFEDDYYYNKKENAVNRAIKIYNIELKDYAKQYNNGNIEEAKEDFDYNGEIEGIKTGNFSCDWVTIKEIDTED